MVTKKVDIHSSPGLQELIAQLDEDVEILIVDGDTALATLRLADEPRPASDSLPPRIPGLHEGSVIWISDDFDDPLPDEFWLGEDDNQEVSK